VKFFGRHREEPAEEIKPAPIPPPLPAQTPKPDPFQPLQINDEKFVSLLKALRPTEKITTILKDLDIDPTKLRLVMGGSGQPTSPRSNFDRESPGPIV
jgi:hypothetical protein